MITDFLGNIFTLVAIIILASEAVSKWDKANGFWSQVQSWVVAVIAGFISSYLGFGFPKATFVTTLIYSVLVGLIANGVFKIPWIQLALSAIGIRYTPPVTSAVSLAAPVTVPVASKTAPLQKQ